MQSCGIYLPLLFTLDIKCVSFFNYYYSFVKVSEKYNQGGGTFVWQWLGVSTKNVSRDDEPGMVEFKGHIRPWQQDAKLSTPMLFSYIICCDDLWMYFTSSGSSILSKFNV